MKKSGLFLFGIAFAFLAGMVFMAVVISRVEKQEFVEIFEKGDVKIGIIISESVSSEIEEISKDITKVFTHQLAGAIMISEEEGTEEYLGIINEALGRAAKTSIQRLRSKLLIVPQNSKNLKTSIF